MVTVKFTHTRGRAVRSADHPQTPQTPLSSHPHRTNRPSSPNILPKSTQFKSDPCSHGNRRFVVVVVAVGVVCAYASCVILDRAQCLHVFVCVCLNGQLRSRMAVYITSEDDRSIRRRAHNASVAQMTQTQPPQHNRPKLFDRKIFASIFVTVAQMIFFRSSPIFGKHVLMYIASHPPPSGPKPPIFGWLCPGVTHTRTSNNVPRQQRVFPPQNTQIFSSINPALLQLDDS